MRHWALVLGLLAAAAPFAALAEAPETAPRPLPRPAVFGVQEVLAATPAAPHRSPRPQPRPGPATPLAVATEAAVVAATAAPRDPVAALLQTLTGTRPASAAGAAAPLAGASALAVARSTRPAPRPKNFVRLAAAAVTAPRAVSRKGSVCGVPEIKGEALAPIDGWGACGIEAPVQVTSVSGVALRQSPRIDCKTAVALNDWVRKGVIPSVGKTGGGVARINVVAHYACRGRNNQKGARLSEHSFGRAVDVSGVTLKDGSTLTVLDHWRSPKFGKIIKAMHASACGPFGTVLGPNADRFHQDHLHVDTARYRSGSYCR
jgi:hypothetical protein